MTSFIKGQLVTADALNAALALYYPTGNISSYSGTLLSSSSQAAWFAALGLPSGLPGAANGLATLNGSGVVPNSQLSAGLTGALYPEGGWNATTNNPALASGVGTQGFFYVVTTSGTTTLDGVSVWAVGDCLFFDGTIWRKINGSGNATVPSTSITDSTSFGRALLTASTVAAQRVDLNIDQATLVVDAAKSITAAMETVVWTSLTATRIGSLPAASTFSQGQIVFIFDESGNSSPTIPITINPAGADTIDGLPSTGIATPFGGMALIRASSTKWTTASLSPNTAGFRNRIINGDMRIDQRNAGGGISIGPSTASYGVDRWSVSSTGASITGARVAGSGTSQYRYQMTGTAGVTGITIQQPIEATNAYDLAGTTVTISADLADSLLTSVNWSLTYANSTDNFGATTAISSGTFTVTSTVKKYIVQAAIPGAATTGLLLSFGVGAQISGTFTIGNVQLEQGYSPTNFEHKPINTELSSCQRYYAKSYSQSVVPGTSQTGGTGGVFAFGTGTAFKFPVTMRAIPTLTIYDNAGTAGKLSFNNGGGWTNNGGILTPGVADSSGFVQANAGVTVLSCDFTASAELI